VVRSVALDRYVVPLSSGDDRIGRDQLGIRPTRGVAQRGRHGRSVAGTELRLIRIILRSVHLPPVPDSDERIEAGGDAARRSFADPEDVMIDALPMIMPSMVSTDRTRLRRAMRRFREVGEDRVTFGRAGAGEADGAGLRRASEIARSVADDHLAAQPGDDDRLRVPLFSQRDLALCATPPLTT